jgi:hypothetical protein
MTVKNQRTVVLRKQEAAPAAPKAKLPREQRLARAAETAGRIAEKRKARSDAATNATIERRRISAKAAPKAKGSAYAKEDAAMAVSSKALRASLSADKRANALRVAAAKAGGGKVAALPKAQRQRPRTVVTPTGNGPAADASIRAKAKAAVRRAGGAKAVETQASQKRIQRGRVMDTMGAKGRGPKTPMQRIDQKIMRNNYIRSNPTRVTSTQYGKAVRSSLTLRDAKKFLATGKPQHTKGTFKSNKAANGIIRNAQKYLSKRK